MQHQVSILGYMREQVVGRVLFKVHFKYSHLHFLIQHGEEPSDLFLSATQDGELGRMGKKNNREPKKN